MKFYGVEIPFATHCGVEPVEFGNGKSSLRVETGPEHANNLGMVHGGLLCTILDIAMGTAARTMAEDAVITLDMQVSFIAPGRGILIATGNVVRAGRSIIFVEAEVRTEDQALVAKSTGIFKPSRRRVAEASDVTTG